MAGPLDDPRRPYEGPESAFFWAGVREGRLLIQRCVACGALRHPPRPACATCRSPAWDVVEASGHGRVHTFCVVHHPRIPGFPEPFVIVIADLDEGVRLLSNLVGVAPGDVRIGMPVEVTYVDAGDARLPLFRPAASR
jgi:uncharacterized protein